MLVVSSFIKQSFVSNLIKIISKGIKSGITEMNQHPQGSIRFTYSGNTGNTYSQPEPANRSTAYTFARSSQNTHAPLNLQPPQHRVSSNQVGVNIPQSEIKKLDLNNNYAQYQK